MKHQPLVVVVFDGYLDGIRGHGITPQERRGETLEALNQLGAQPPLFMGFRDDQLPARLDDSLANLARNLKPETVFAPAYEEGGHEQHNLVALAARRAFKNVCGYLSYTKSGKSVGVPVPIEPGMIQRKLRALACYSSQIELKTCREHFLREQNEYLAA